MELREKEHKILLPEFTQERKKSYYHFFKQIVDLGIQPDQEGYRLLSNILRRILLLPEENFPKEDSEDVLFYDMSEFVSGLTNAPVELQKDILVIILRILPPFFQNQFINSLLSFENHDSSQTFMCDYSLGEQLIRAVTEIERKNEYDINIISKLQKIVENHLDEFENKVKERTSKELIQLLNDMLTAIMSSAHEIPQLEKIVCINIAKVSTEEKRICRITGLFINQYVGGLMAKKSEVISASSRTLPFLSGLASRHLAAVIPNRARFVRQPHLHRLEKFASS